VLQCERIEREQDRAQWKFPEGKGYDERSCERERDVGIREP